MAAKCEVMQRAADCGLLTDESEIAFMVSVCMDSSLKLGVSAEQGVCPFAIIGRLAGGTSKAGTLNTLSETAGVENA